jgi:hypothetical protein
LPDKNSQTGITYLIAALLILIAILLAEQDAALSSLRAQLVSSTMLSSGASAQNTSAEINATTHKSPTPAAMLQINLYASPLRTVQNLHINVSGPGLSFSLPLNYTGTYPYLAANALEQNSTYNSTMAINSSQTQISANGSATTGSYPAIIPYFYPERYSLIFANLREYSYYNVTISGYSRPYCYRGVACPMFISLIHMNYTIETGGPGSISELNISA